MNTILKAYLNDLEGYCNQQQWENIISVCQDLIDHASQQIDAVAPLPLEGQGESEMYQLKGTILANQQDIEGAISAYQHALLLSPDNVDAAIALATLYIQSDEWAQAADTYQQVLQAKPSLNLAYRLMTVLEHSTQPDLAVTLLYQTFQAESQSVDADAYFKLGNRLAQLDRIEESITCYEEAIASNPQRADVHFSLGTSFAQLEDWPSALAAYEQTMIHNPKSARAHYAAGECCMRQGESKQALKYFQAAVELNPNLAAGHAKLGHLWHQLGNIKKATNACLTSLKIQPNLSDPFVKLRYNILRYDVGRQSTLLNDVVQTCEAILDQYPDTIPIQSLLGYTLTRQKNYGEAIQYYKRASIQKAQKAKPNMQAKVWTSEHCIPSFIILGAFKCATTSIYQYINRHPNVLPSLEKELDFFDSQFQNGLDWYFSHFPPVSPSDNIITGEATPNYFYNFAAPERIFRSLPNIKLILVLRNPIERTVSHYNFLQRNVHNPKPIEEVLDREIKNLSKLQLEDGEGWDEITHHSYVGHSLYVYYLKKWFKYFKEDQLLILKHEDLSEFPAKTLETIFNYLNLPVFSIPEYKKYKLGQYAPISSEMRQKLGAFFRPHTLALESLLNRTFDWDGTS